jgi:hypothetical protein
VRGRSQDRRRFAAAYACSFLIHALALVLLAAFAVHPIEDEPAESIVADTELTVRVETPAPRVAVAPPPHPHHELARVRPSAPPQPTPPPRPLAVIEPTASPTLVPTERPTAAPAERPTLAPTPAPTEHPTFAPTESPTTVPTERPSPIPTEHPATPSPAAAPPAAPAASAPPAPPTPRPAPPPPPPPPPAAAIAAAAPPASALANLNARMRAALPSASPPGMQRIDVGAYSTERVLDAYEAALAPPLEILAKTFGLIYTTRTVTRADSVAYVYERTRDVVGREVCRAYRITEHPVREATPPPNHLGPGVVEFPRPLPDVTPRVETVDVSCRAPGMIPVDPGSLTSPVPRRPPTPAP